LNASSKKQIKRQLKTARRQEAAERHDITDHAIVRYMERIMGINITEFCQTIFDNEKIDLVRHNGKIVTVTLKQGKHKG